MTITQSPSYELNYNIKTNNWLMKQWHLLETLRTYRSERTRAYILWKHITKLTNTKAASNHQLQSRSRRETFSLFISKKLFKIARQVSFIGKWNFQPQFSVERLLSNVSLSLFEIILQLIV